MAKQGKGSSAFKKFATTCVVLIAAQIGYLSLYSNGPVELTPKDSVEAALKASGEVPEDRRETLKIQLALADYRARNGSFPKQLDQLIPAYFDSIPKDPVTAQPVAYTLENGKYRLGVSSAKKPGTVDDLKLDPILLATLEQDSSERASFVYDPTGKRDPFVPFDVAPKVISGTGTELEQYAIGQLRYTSFLGSSGEPIAIVENSVRKGFTVRRGTKIGTNGGAVVDILPSKILVLESAIDPITGEKKNTTIEMELRPNTKK